MSTETGAWTCPACGRLVPRTVDACRCGAPRPAAAQAPIEPPRSSAHTAIVLMGTIILILAGALTYVLTGGRTVKSAIGAARPSAAGSPAPAAMPASTPLSAPPTDDPTPPDLPPPLPPTDNPSDSPRSLEDMIAAATPAVVAIQSDSARGSGFFVRSDTLVTNAHVVRGSSTVAITFADNRKGEATVVNVPGNVDLALLKAAPGSDSRAVLELASVATVRPGEEVVAIGSALGVLQNTVTRGIVSALRQDNGVLLLQTDAAINPGNSGGPLLDRDGRVVGVNTMKVGTAASIGFALSADHVRALLDSPANSMLALPGAAAATPGTAAFPPMPTTAGDNAHARAVAAYDGFLEAEAKQADQIDVYWNRFKHACNASPTWRGGDREWFGFWSQPPDVRANVVDCRQLVDDLLQATSAIRSRMTTANDTARRTGVYPGEARDLRHRHRLGWDGWDR